MILLSSSLLKVRDVHTEFHHKKTVTYAVNGAQFEIMPGEVVGLVGESGCGKSVLQQTILNILPTGADVSCCGSAVFDGNELLPQSTGSACIRNIHGKKIAMIFQNPTASLNPVIPVGEQISEVIRTHLKLSKAESKKRALEMMRKVNIPNAHLRYSDYPHQFSGGMCQRIMIAMAISCSPELVIADEITTALDVTTQAQIFELLKSLVDEMGMALLIISHNIGLVAHYADRIYIMYAGQMMEWGTSKQIFFSPAHAYTRALLMAVPSLFQSREQPLVTIPGIPPDLHDKISGCPFYPRCEFKRDICRSSKFTEIREIETGHFTHCLHDNFADLTRKTNTFQRVDCCRGDTCLSIENLSKTYRTRFRNPFNKAASPVHAVQNVSFSLHEGEILGLVGESGCGKSTIARCILGITEPSGGIIRSFGTDLTEYRKTHPKHRNTEIQLVFQDAAGSFDPRQTVGEIISEPILVQNPAIDHTEANRLTDDLLNLVKLDTSLKGRRPSELSGGQQQRVSIARALASNPRILICDEPLSALDVCAQAQIINLFLELKSKLGLAILFISHDLSAVRYLCDNIIVMYRGQIVESGSWEHISSVPVHPYTKALMTAAALQDTGSLITSDKEDVSLSAAAAQAMETTGCPYYHSCSNPCKSGKSQLPAMREIAPGHFVACHKAADA